MKKAEQPKSKDKNRKDYHEWLKRRDVVLRSIPLQVDLENRELFFGDEIRKKLKFDFGTNNIDNLIDAYVPSEDMPALKQSLNQAKLGKERPISFRFIHPLTSEKLKFEYRYEIVYVRYASTRLSGVLVNVREGRKVQSRGQIERNSKI